MYELKYFWGSARLTILGRWEQNAKGMRATPKRVHCKDTCGQINDKRGEMYGAMLQGQLHLTVAKRFSDFLPSQK